MVNGCGVGGSVASFTFFVFVCSFKFSFGIPLGYKVLKLFKKYQIPPTLRDGQNFNCKQNILDKCKENEVNSVYSLGIPRRVL
uniref:Uncharacterized protein n=1 Tax=Meloidogyne incognita TaxID=6306 RepID=A0A914LUY7_MELIC